MDELIRDFLVETNESLVTLDAEILKLEQNPTDQTLLGSIFRIMHTIKGTCGFLGLSRLQAVAHAGENVLGKIRDGGISTTAEIVSLILKAIDQIKMIVESISANGHEPEGSDAELINMLNKAATGADPTAKSTSKEPEADEFGFVPVKAEETASITLFDPAPVSAPAAASAPEPKPKQQKEEAKHNSTAPQASIRVNVDVLEALMQMVSELVLTRNQLAQITRNTQDSKITMPIQRLSLITSELQEKVMKTRMQPISNAWAPFPRMVRDLAMDLGKKIELKMIGEETELDRQLIESIKDPLTHMVRNSADHGIETIEERRAAGKPDHGTITLKAYHQGGHIILEISDDGKGLNIGKIKEKAIKNGLATEVELEEMTEKQITQFIFKAGFSTAEKVTAVSGRGVGMDVVKTNIEKISGNIELKSVEGKGSTFVIKIPLTLAIMSILIVECRGEKFGIPQINILEIVRAGANSEYHIEKINEYSILKLRDKLLPLISLAHVLGFDDIKDNKEASYVVVCEIGGHNFGVIVDRIFDTEEIVVKPVAPVLKQIEIYSGSTLLGDGRVIMIIDPNALAKTIGEGRVSGTSTKTRGDTLITYNSSEYASFLIIRSSDDLYKAVPIEFVSRLEEIDVTKIEYSAGKPVVQYRNNLLRLVKLEENYEIPKTGMQQVIVFSHGQNVMGLMVKEVFDIVEHKVEIIHSIKKEGLIGALVIDDRTTDIIDVTVYFQRAFGIESLLDTLKDVKQMKIERSILLVDDSPFFRKCIPPLLTKEGYNVIAAPGAKEALDLIEKNDFRVIVTDLNMPYMDGIQFASILKMNPKNKETPIVALSGDDEGKRSKDELKDFVSFVSKTNHRELVKVIKLLERELDEK